MQVLLKEHGHTEKNSSGHTSEQMNYLRSYRTKKSILPEAVTEKKRYRTEQNLSKQQKHFSQEQEEKPFDLISSQAINSSLYC